ncbi:MAG: hypothetical protein LBR84_07060, partial [Tannerella sp.]|nr:hypothetical protein [Tannerella sp.]
PERIKQILLNGKLSIKEIHRKLNFDKSEQVLKTELNKLDFIEISKLKNRNYFSLKGKKETLLFNDI